MPDTAPLSEAHTADRLHAAFAALGDAPGATIRAESALSVARKGLGLIPRPSATPIELDNQPLSDVEAHNRIYRALEALGHAPAETERANVLLNSARIGLSLIAASLMDASVRAEQD